MSKATKVEIDLYNVKTNKIYKISSQYLKKLQRKVKRRAITPVKVGQV